MKLLPKFNHSGAFCAIERSIKIKQRHAHPILLYLKLFKEIATLRNRARGLPAFRKQIQKKNSFMRLEKVKALIFDTNL